MRVIGGNFAPALGLVGVLARDIGRASYLTHSGIHAGWEFWRAVLAATRDGAPEPHRTLVVGAPARERWEFWRALWFSRPPRPILGQLSTENGVVGGSLATRILLEVEAPGREKGFSGGLPGARAGVWARAIRRSGSLATRNHGV